MFTRRNKFQFFFHLNAFNKEKKIKKNCFSQMVFTRGFFFKDNAIIIVSNINR